MNLARLGEESLDRYGEYVSLAFEGREWTNVEQRRAAHRFARALGRLGLRPGDRVVVLLPNCPEVLQAYTAILQFGGVIVPVVFLLSPEEVRHILADSEARVVVTAAQFVDKIAGWTGPVVLVGGGGGGLAWDDLVAGQPEDFATVHRDDRDLAVILYTAGTTGQPKGAATIVAFCQERLAKYKCPKQVRFVDALPKSPIGKILRKELRALAD